MLPLHTIATGAEDFPLTCDDPASGQSLTFATQGGKQIVTYRSAADAAGAVLTDSEASELNAWRNGGRRHSYWNWPGLEAVRQRSNAA